MKCEHPDTGCRLRPRCLECNLPYCQFDETKIMPTTATKAPLILKLRAEGYSIDKIAKELRVGKSTIVKILRRA